MKKLSLILFTVFIAMLFFAVQPAMAAELKISKIGTVDVSSLDLGGTLSSYTYSGGTFEMAGTASPSATVSIVIDDVTKTATSDALGNWSSLISSLTTGDHDVTVSSDLDILDFTLTIGTSNDTGTGGATASATTSTTSATTTSTLPEAGSLSMSILTLAAAMFMFGLGVLLKAGKH